jgi:site-specific DNA recombinase
MFRDVLQGKTLYAIARDLMAQGIPTATGKPYWATSVISRMLRERFYTGEKYAFASTGARSGQEPIRLPDGVVPPLVSVEDFEAVGERLKKNRELSSRNNRQPHAAMLRGGFVKCGLCGNNLIVERKREGAYEWFRYRCNNRRLGCRGHSISVEQLDQEVWQALKDWLTELENAPDPAAILNANCGDDETVVAAQLAKLQTLLDHATAEMRVVSRQIAILEDDEDAVGPLRAELARLRADKERHEAERNHLQGMRIATVEQRAELRYFLLWVVEYCERLNAMSYDERRDLLTKLRGVVKVYPMDGAHADRWVLDGMTAPWQTFRPMTADEFIAAEQQWPDPIRIMPMSQYRAERQGTEMLEERRERRWREAVERGAIPADLPRWWETSAVTPTEASWIETPSGAGIVLSTAAGR